MKKIMLLLAVALMAVTANAGKVLKVLAIGNSFSEDAVEQYLYELAAAQGDSLVIGNAYIGGCSIDRHWSNAQTGKPEYRYRKITGGKTVTRKSTDLGTIIRDDQWDIISLQQVSYLSGMPYSFGNLANLKSYVLNTCSNPKVEIIWHMTWAYAKNSKHGCFRYYKKDQQLMYNNIVLTTRYTLPEFGIQRVVPVGIAIQEARDKMGDVLTRDGFHLEKTYGRYTAACTWCEFLTGRKVTGNPYRPKDVDPQTALTAQRAAHKAMKSFRLQP